jgi:hypothetical protein
MKDHSDSTIRLRQLSRSKNKRSLSKSNYRSSNKLDGIKFIKPVADKENTCGSPTKSSVIKADFHKNKTSIEIEKPKPTEESDLPRVEYNHVSITVAEEREVSGLRSVSQKFYDRLTQFSQIQDNLNE